MNEYVCVSLCVYGWVAKEGIFSPAYLKQHRGVQKTFLCLYWCEALTKNCACEDQKRRMNDVSQSRAERQLVRSETPKQRVRHSKLGTWVQAVKNEDTEQ